MAKDLLAEAVELDPVPTGMPVPGAPNGTTELLKVRDLIELLASADPEAPVVVRGPYGGFDYVRDLAPLGLRLNVNTLAGFGPHDVPGDAEGPDTVAMALLSSADSEVLD